LTKNRPQEKKELLQHLLQDHRVLLHQLPPETSFAGDKMEATLAEAAEAEPEKPAEASLVKKDVVGQKPRIRIMLTP
jgi:hypothetical protein